MKNRREILRHAGAVSLAASAGTLLQACASTPAVPEPPPKPVALLGLLPVGPEAGAPRDGPRMAGGIVVPHYFPGRSYSSRAGLVAGLLSIEFGGGGSGGVEVESFGASSSRPPLGVDVAAMLNERLLTELRARNLTVLSMADPTLVREVRSHDTKSIPPEVDAILDVKLVQAFFATSWRSRGYSPTINVYALVTDPQANMDELMGYTSSVPTSVIGERVVGRHPAALGLAKSS